MNSYENHSYNPEAHTQSSQNTNELGLIIEAIIQEPNQKLGQIAEELSIVARKGKDKIRAYLETH